MVEKRFVPSPSPMEPQSWAVVLFTKNFRVISLFFPADDQATRCAMLIGHLCFPGSSTELLPYTFRSQYAPDKQTNGFNVYSQKSDYERLGLFETKWRVSIANNQYGVCTSFSPIVVLMRLRSAARIPSFLLCRRILTILS